MGMGAAKFDRGGLEMSIVFSCGRWGGIYFGRGYGWRICLGWVAVTFFPEDIDDIVRDAAEWRCMDEWL